MSTCTKCGMLRDDRVSSCPQCGPADQDAVESLKKLLAGDPRDDLITHLSGQMSSLVLWASAILTLRQKYGAMLSNVTNNTKDNTDLITQVLTAQQTVSSLGVSLAMAGAAATADYSTFMDGLPG